MFEPIRPTPTNPIFSVIIVFVLIVLFELRDARFTSARLLPGICPATLTTCVEQSTLFRQPISKRRLGAERGRSRPQRVGRPRRSGKGRWLRARQPAANRDGSRSNATRRPFRAKQITASIRTLLVNGCCDIRVVPNCTMLRQAGSFDAGFFEMNSGRLFSATGFLTSP